LTCYFTAVVDAVLALGRNMYHVPPNATIFSPFV
jgi:hypothetical protein